MFWSATLGARCRNFDLFGNMDCMSWSFGVTILGNEGRKIYGFVRRVMY